MYYIASSLIQRDSDVFLYIGVKLWKHLSIEEYEISIFTVVEVLIRAIDSVHDSEVRVKMAELFHEASNETKKLLDFKKANNYLEIAIQLLGPDCWKENYELSIKTYAQAAFASMICAQKGLALGTKNIYRIYELTGFIIQNAKCSAHRLTASIIRIKCMVENQMHDEGLKIGIEFLDSVGINLDINQSPSKTASQIQEVKDLFSESTPEDISTMKRMNDENLLAGLKMLALMSSPTNNFDCKLIQIIGSRILWLTHTHGISVHSAAGFVIIGSTISSEGDEVGYKFGKLSIHIVKNASKEFVGMVPGIYTGFYWNIAPWFESFHDSLGPLLKAYAIGHDRGNILAVSQTSKKYLMLAFVAGESLKYLSTSIDEIKTLIPMTPQSIAALHQVIINLTHRYHGTAASLDEEFNFDAFDGQGQLNEKPHIYTLAIINSYLFRDYFSALKYVEASTDQCLSQIEKTLLMPLQSFYACLVLLAIAKQSKKEDQIIENVKKVAEKLENISKHSPKNFRHKVYLLDAEIAVVSGDVNRVVYSFELSISLAKENRYKNDEALACERAGMFFLSQNESEKGFKFLSQACFCYNEWGATAKVDQLLRKHSSLFKEFDDSVSIVGTEFQFVKNSESSFCNSSQVSLRSSLKSTTSISRGNRKRVKFSKLV